VVLASRSTYFEAQFSHDFAEKKDRVATYNDVPYDFMLMFLRHIYSDTLKVESKYIYELLSVSQSYCNTRLLVGGPLLGLFFQEEVRADPGPVHLGGLGVPDLQIRKQV
jgi:hypothetical protein